MDFKGKYALVTGGGTGIGRAVAAALGERGTRVCITGRRAGKLAETCDSLSKQGVSVQSIACDISRADSIDELAGQIVEETARVHFLVNNAGVYLKGEVAEMPEAEWDATFAVNVKSIYLLVRKLLPAMQDSGASIVNIASTLAYQTALGTGAYAASKAAVVSLTKSMAREFGENGIRVNCICPGVVDTPVHDRYFHDQKEKETFFKSIAEAVPLGRAGKPEDIASAVIFLLSEDSSWITGSVLAVDGGMSLL